MAVLQGFWSYVHKDDQAESGRISQLARDIVEQYQMLTGEEIQLFLDKDDIEWGDKWREKIDSNLSSVAFFIPVITPRFFMSSECRRELHYFLRKANDLGMQELILPLYYVNVPNFNDELTKDELIKLLRNLQYEDWRKLRFSDLKSEQYRENVAKLAEKLVEANKHAEESTPIIAMQLGIVSEETEDDTPGIIDTLAESEEMLNKLPETLESIAQDISQIGQIMNEATENIKRADDQGKGFSARLINAKQTASYLIEPTERIWSRSNIYASQLHSIDLGFRIIIERAPIEIKENPEEKSSICHFFDNIRTMSSASDKAIESLGNLFTAADPLERMARDFRPVLRRLKQGLTILIESSGVIQDWLHLINNSDIDCLDITT